MAYPGIGLAIMIGFALGSAIYYYMKSDSQPHNSYSYQQKSIPYESPVTTTAIPSSSKRTNRTTRRRQTKKCVICLELLTQNKTPLKCGHEFHSTCINTWFSQSDSTRCPLCSRTNDKECIICYEPCSNNKLHLKCGHTFHDYCIQKWFRESRTCPLCRAH